MMVAFSKRGATETALKERKESVEDAVAAAKAAVEGGIIAGGGSALVPARQARYLAENRRYVSMNAFAAVKGGMREEEVRRLIGLPREDWIKQVIQNGRVYSVWIYPKADGGASAVM